MNILFSSGVNQMWRQGSPYLELHMAEAEANVACKRLTANTDGSKKLSVSIVIVSNLKIWKN